MVKAESLAQRIAALDWPALEAALEQDGFAVAPPLLTPEECEALIALYGDAKRFRSRIVMQRQGYGAGEYQYFGYPLPRPVASLRRALYERLVPIANSWAEALGATPFPAKLDDYLARCHEAGQQRPTPLMLRYRAGDYNRLHQDLYGALAFPLQAAICLSRRDADFSGGEFLLVEQRPRMQLRGEAVALDQGQMIVFPNNQRPVQGARGTYRVKHRHGVSRLRSGERYTLGIIFHDAA
ncbi:MAG: 2OG-Fe(II) oxygenase [Kiloniellales bacterium]